MKRYLITIMIAMCLALSLNAVGETAAGAQTQPATEARSEAASEAATGGEAVASGGDSVDVAEYVLNSNPEEAGRPMRSRPETPKADYRKFFRYTENVLMRGIFKTYSFFFSIPEYWQTRYALAQIEYTVSPMIRDVPASMTFFINRYPIYSCGVDYADGATQILFVPIGVELLRDGYNEFSVSSFVRFYDEEGCLDDFSGSNWISLSKGSYIEAGYDLMAPKCRISDYPYPLISTLDESGSELTLYVPEGATEEELRAAFMLRADLANATTDEDEIEFRTTKNYPGEDRAALIVARRDRLPDEAKVRLPQGAKTGGGALVYEYLDGERCVVVVTADDDKDLFEGACMLMDEDRVKQQKSDAAFVPAGSTETVIVNRSLSALIQNGETIKGITDQDGLRFTGPFHQESIIYLPLSGGFMLGEGGKVELQMRYSDNLDFDRSMVTVYWGNTPVASRKLEREKAGMDTFSFLMPSDVVGTHAASITIAFDLEIKELYCTKRADEMPWAYVSGESMLYLPSGSGSTYDLSLRPFPFQKLGLFNSLAVVTPDSMTDAEYALLGRLAALWGTNISPYGNMEVWFASNYPAETENRNIITLGTWADNSLIQALNDKLSFRYAEDGSQFESNNQLVLSEDYGANIGVLQIIRSPWQEGRAILVASGPSDAALDQINRFAAVQENTWTLAGDAFLIDKDLETKDYRFLEEQVQQQLSLKERIQEHKDALLFTLISTSAMLMMLIAVLLILFRYRRNRREEGRK